MIGYGVGTAEQRIGDLLVALTRGDQAQHLCLAVAQAARISRCARVGVHCVRELPGVRLQCAHPEVFGYEPSVL